MSTMRRGDRETSIYLLNASLAAAEQTIDIILHNLFGLEANSCLGQSKSGFEQYVRSDLLCLEVTDENPPNFFPFSDFNSNPSYGVGGAAAAAAGAGRRKRARNAVQRVATSPRKLNQ